MGNTGERSIDFFPSPLLGCLHALSSSIPLVWLQYGGSKGPRNPLLSVRPRIRPLSGDTSRRSENALGLESSVFPQEPFSHHVIAKYLPVTGSNQSNAKHRKWDSDSWT
ncbi:hypothetical protein E4U57_004168 [Claviceps arundinis]|uniref:Uncharacterized protein n=1 Tax=Claviceps arundinis TaxID=1623583 RepID=A0ABQ7P5G9_9HYPO|nr:hypothetical protein E4U57_004168 [Claviceps arundinis]